MKNLIVIFCLSLVSCLNAQKSDYVWLSGYDSQVGFSTHWGFYFGASVLDFNHPQMQISYDTLKMNFDATNTSFCDSNGNLQFYTNGIYIANSLDQKIDNSDSMNAGWLQYTRYPLIQQYGYRTAQAILALEYPNIKNQFYLFHIWLDSVGANRIVCKKLLLTNVDMNANAGLGKVFSKNEAILQGLLGVEITATRHGNGRDWWILEQERNTNCYYPILINDTGIAIQPVTCGGLTVIDDDLGSVCFSPDGSKYAYMSYYHGLDLFDFDRCTGQLSNPLNIPIHTNGYLGMGVAISPNNRFLYLSYTYQVYQFDLQAADVAASIDTVAVFDSTNAPFPAIFNTAQNGPDGRIYFSCGNADTVYHVINNPDLKGDSCNFLQHSVILPSPSWGVPNFPNYRLGAWQGSPCDTLSLMTSELRAEKEKILKVYPNPATDIVTIDYGFTDWNKGEVNLEITNALGQLMHSQKLPMYSGYQKIDVTQFPAGVYNACIKRRSASVAVSKFVKQ